MNSTVTTIVQTTVNPTYTGDTKPVFVAPRKKEDVDKNDIGHCGGDSGIDDEFGDAPSATEQQILRDRGSNNYSSSHGGGNRSYSDETVVVEENASYSGCAQKGSLQRGDYLSALLNGNLSKPADQHAAKVMDKFLGEKGLQNLSKDEMRDIARTGYYTAPNGKITRVPDSVRDAAVKMSKNDFALMDKISGNGDGKRTTTTTTVTVERPGDEGYGRNRPSEMRAGRTLADFQDATGEASLSKEQVASLAKTGQFKNADGEVVYAPPAVQDAAKRLMENGGALFDKIESASDNRHDGKLGSNNFHDAARQGMLTRASEEQGVTVRRVTTTTVEDAAPPQNTAERRKDVLAGLSVAAFQLAHGDLPLTRTQLQQIADTGKCTLPDGSELDASGIQGDAKRLMDDGGKLFSTIESATTRDKDDLLMSNDFGAALKHGDIGFGSYSAEPKSTTTTTTTVETVGGYGGELSPREEFNAARSVANWQDESGNASLTKGQMSDIAEKGYFTKPNGDKVYPPADVREAARDMMANGGALFDKVESSTTGTHDGKLGSNNFHDAVANHDLAPHGRHSVSQDLSPRMELSAARTMANWQDESGNGSLTKGQVAEIAEKGYFTKPNGDKVYPPADVREAAKDMMLHGGALFDKIESASDGKHDGKLGSNNYHDAVDNGTLGVYGGRRRGEEVTPREEFNAGRSIANWQDESGNGSINKKQMGEIAEKGYFTKANGDKVYPPADVREAAKAMMANDGALFDKIESASDGKHDGKLGSNNFHDAVNNGELSLHHHRRKAEELTPREEFNAGRSFANWQDESGNGSINKKQMAEIAEKGYFTKPNGDKVYPPADVREAAKAMMANGGELFDKIESASDGKHDGKLGSNNFHDAVRSGELNRNSHYSYSEELTPRQEFVSARKIADWQDESGNGSLTRTQMKDIAEKGFFTRPNGDKVYPPADVRTAAKDMMANDGALFDKIESASDHRHDGKLGSNNFHDAVRDGVLDAKSATAQDAPPVRRTVTTVVVEEVEDDENDSADRKDVKAGRTMANFMRDTGAHSLTATQMADIADTGKYTDKDGKEHFAPANVQAAAGRMMDNGGDLFKRYETSVKSEPDGIFVPNDFDTAIRKGMVGHDDDEDYSYDDEPVKTRKTVTTTVEVVNGRRDVAAAERRDLNAATSVANWQKESGQTSLTKDQMGEIAEKGYFSNDQGQRVYPPADVRQAAKVMMENDGELFDRIESATTNKHDRVLVPNDLTSALEKGRIGIGSTADGYSYGDDNGKVKSVTTVTRVVEVDHAEDTPGRRDVNAGRAIANFQDDTGNPSMSKAQMAELAENGSFKNDQGIRVYAPPEVQAAARRMMANDGALFDRIESASDNKHDGRLGSNNFHDARNKGVIGNESECDDSTRTVRTITIEVEETRKVRLTPREELHAGAEMAKFQLETGNPSLSKEQMAELAATGSFTNDKGEKVHAPPEVQAAAKDMMFNGGELYDKVAQDGDLSVVDFAKALGSGKLGIASAGYESDTETTTRTITITETSTGNGYNDGYSYGNGNGYSYGSGKEPPSLEDYLNRVRLADDPGSVGNAAWEGAGIALGDMEQAAGLRIGAVRA